jgi:hypothetical protein
LFILEQVLSNLWQLNFSSKGSTLLPVVVQLSSDYS